LYVQWLESDNNSLLSSVDLLSLLSREWNVPYVASYPRNKIITQIWSRLGKFLI